MVTKSRSSYFCSLEKKTGKNKELQMAKRRLFFGSFLPPLFDFFFCFWFNYNRSQISILQISITCQKNGVKSNKTWNWTTSSTNHNLFHFCSFTSFWHCEFRYFHWYSRSFFPMSFVQEWVEQRKTKNIVKMASKTDHRICSTLSLNHPRYWSTFSHHQ